MDYDGTIESGVVRIEIPYGTNRSSLIASFTVSSAASVTLAASTQVSGVSVNDFTTARAYLVTAEDGSQATYTVSVVQPIWTQQAYLKAPNAEAGDGFGRAVSSAVIRSW